MDLAKVFDDLTWDNVVERARLDIQQLSAALSMETNEMLRQDIQSDNFALLNRKKMLAEKLNLN